jgi:hypothetical protein
MGPSLGGGKRSLQQQQSQQPQQNQQQQNQQGQQLKRRRSTGTAASDLSASAFCSTSPGDMGPPQRRLSVSSPSPFDQVRESIRALAALTLVVLVCFRCSQCYR